MKTDRGDVQPRLLSLVIPCFNEAAVLGELAERLTAFLPTLGMSWEVVFVGITSGPSWKPLLPPARVSLAHALDSRPRGRQNSRDGSWGAEEARNAVIDPPGVRRDNGAVQAKGLHRFLLGTACALVIAAATTGLAQPARPADYEIGAGDVLKVVVLGQADMTGNFTVGPDGMVSFPILGKVKASESTTFEIERKLTVLLADGILKRPQVTVTVGEYGSQKVFVTGEVQRPGQYSLKADRSLLALLGDVGALGSNVGHEVIVVRPPAGAATATGPAVPLSRTEDPGPVPAAEGSSKGTPPAAAPAQPMPPESGIPGLPFVAPGSEVFRISLLELQSGNPERNITLRAGDTVYFPRAAQVYVMGSVSRPGPYRYQEGMTVLQALTLAGGATERGSAGRTKVVRIVNGKKVEKKVKATELVLPEDTLVVPERFF